jgi:spore germination protein
MMERSTQRPEARRSNHTRLRPGRLLVLALALAVVASVAAAALSFQSASEEGAMVTFGFVPYWDQEQGFEEVDRYAEMLSTVGPWWFAPTADGRVVEQHEEYTDVDLDLVERLQQRGRRVMPAIANHRNGSWDFEVVGELLSDPEAVDRHIASLTDLVVDQGFDGLQLDYENLEAEDALRYAEFVGRLADAFHEHGKTLAVAVHAKRDADTGGWGAGHDHELLGRHADELHLMAYDYHYNESSPGPPAPSWWVDEVLHYTTGVVPSEKVILGIGMYGYDWGGGTPAEGLTLQEVQERIRRYSGELAFDERSQTPRFAYVADGHEHELWFENARSIERKLEFVHSYELGGAFFWRLGGTTEEVWRGVADALELPPP